MNSPVNILAVFLRIKILISAYLSALEPQVAGIGSAGSIQHSSSRELPRATASPCLNTRGPEAAQKWPRNEFRPITAHPPLCCGRERQLLIGRKLSTLQLQLGERILIWNYQIITGIAKMTVPTSRNNISPTGECFTQSFCLLSWPYVRHELWQPHRHRLSSGLTRSTAKLQNTQNNFNQICPITLSSHHSHFFDKPQDFSFASNTNNPKTSSQTVLTHARSGPPFTHTHTPMDRKSQWASLLPGPSQCQTPVNPTWQIQSNLSHKDKSLPMKLKKLYEQIEFR